MLSFYFITNGRISRRATWLAVVMPLTALTIVGGTADSLLFQNQEVTFLGNAYAPITAVVAVLIAWPSLATSIRRFHDLNMTGWWAAPMLALYWLPNFSSFLQKSVAEKVVIVVWVICAFLAVVLGLAQLFVPGIKDSNRFGADPLRRI